MALDINPTMAVVISGILSGVVTPVVAFALTEYRLARQRRWDDEDRARIAAEARAHLDQVHADVMVAGEKATSAYNAANAVNLWRNDLTALLTEKQDKAMRVVEDTNAQVRLARDMFLVPAIVSAAHAALEIHHDPKTEKGDEHGKHPDVD